MEDRRLARNLALSRIAVGGAALIFPGAIGGLWVGRDGRRAGAKVILRGFAVRDVALGFGLKTAIDRQRPARGWLEGGMLADTGDFVATLLGGGDLPLPGRLLALAAAGSGAAVAGMLARRIDAPAAEAGGAPAAFPGPAAGAGGAAPAAAPGPVA